MNAESNQNFWSFRSENWFYLAFLLASASAILVSSRLHVSSPIISELMHEFGFAGFIAIILVYTVERVARERHQKAADQLLSRVNTDLFEAIYQRYIPPEVFSEVEKCLFNTSVVRTDYSIDYTLEHFDTSSELQATTRENHFRCEVFSRFCLRNDGDLPATQVVEMNVELPIEPELQHLIGFDRLRIGNHDLSDDEIERASNKAENHLEIRRSVTVPPKGVLKIEMGCYTIKRKLDMEVWASRLPSTGLQLRVNSPPDCEVKATANHYEKLEQSTLMGNRSVIWDLPHGIFPFQSVIFWWDAENRISE